MVLHVGSTVLHSDDDHVQYTFVRTHAIVSQGHTQRVNAIAYGAEGGSVLVSASYDTSVRCWDCRSRIPSDAVYTASTYGESQVLNTWLAYDSHTHISHAKGHWLPSVVSNDQQKLGLSTMGGRLWIVRTHHMADF